MTLGLPRSTRLRCTWLTLLALLGCDDPAAPIVSTAELQLQQIYDARAWLEKVPVQQAAAFYARAKLESFVEELGLPQDVRARLSARVAAQDFVDELVPFLLFLRDMYQAPRNTRGRAFDAHFRAHFHADDSIPGLVHDMFSWQRTPKSESVDVSGLPPEIAREFVALYDVLFLRDPQEVRNLGERLACESRQSGAALARVTRTAMPAVRTLIEALHGQMRDGGGGEAESDLGGALESLLEDSARLEAATSAVIRFVDQTVCRNYRFFAARAVRADQLRRWMLAELERPSGGALWRYLEHANRERRYGVVVVVDGLQGRLVEALARGQADSAFLRAIVAEQEARGGEAPAARSLRAPASQQTEFLVYLARQGFSHPDYLPFFRGLLSSPRTAWVPVGVSTTPTISVRNIPIALTGAPVAGPGATGLPNFHFVDRHYEQDGEQRGRAYYFYGSDAVELVNLTRRAGMRTLAERLPQLSSLSCTAQYDEAFHFGIDAMLNLGLGERLRDFGDQMCAEELDLRAENERALADRRGELLELRRSLTRRRPWWQLWSRFGQRQELALARRWIAEIARREQRAMPELVTYYNPWPDHFAHFEGPFADEIISPSGELNRLDYWLRRLQSAYRRAGVEERTLIAIAGDHGLAPVFHLLNPEVEIFDALREEGTDFRVVKISSDEGEGPKLTNPYDPPSLKGIDVVVASTAGGNYMLDLFLDQQARFDIQPVASELRDLRPLTAPPGAPPVDLLAEISLRLADSLDYLAVRETACSPERCAVRLMGHRDGRPAQALLRREGERVHYAFEGADLLDTGTPSPYEDLSDAARGEHARLRERCLEAAFTAPQRWCDESEWRRLTSYTPRPDSVVQLAHLYDEARAGTINLFPRAGVGYNSQVPGRHAGESFHEKNALVALWGAPLRSQAARSVPRSAVIGSLPMAIYEWLSGEPAEPGSDGWGFERLGGLLAAH